MTQVSNKNNNTNTMGPQGTQVFDLSSVNAMLAAEISESEDEHADTPAIIGVSDAVMGQRFLLLKDKVEVGRRPSSDVVIDHASVSAMHAQLIKDGNDWKVLNLLSSNGTFVNGEKVVEQKIQKGDRIGFGGAEFVFARVVNPGKEKPEMSSYALIAMGMVLLSALAGILYFLL